MASHARPFWAVPFHHPAAQETFGTLFGSSEHVPFQEELAVYRKRMDEAHEPTDEGDARGARRHSTGGKPRLPPMSEMGQSDLGRLSAVGAMVSVIRNAGPAGV